MSHSMKFLFNVVEQIIAYEPKKDEKRKRRICEKSDCGARIEDLPFPRAHFMTKEQVQEKKEEEILNLFSKFEINMPLLELISKGSRYANVLKELCDRKRNA